MKKSIKFFWCMALCALPAGICNAQTEETTLPTIKVEDAPAWFFNPSEGEYAGVSLPFKNYELARQQAAYSALLSFAAQNKTTMTVQGVTKSYSDAQGNKENSQFESSYKCTFSLPDQYRVVETAVNQYGEVFVLISVNDVGRDSTIQVVAEQYAFYAKEDGLGKSGHWLDYTLKESRSLPEAEVVYVHGKNVILNEETTVNMQIERVTKYSSAQETAVPEATYRYLSTIAFEKSDNGETKMPLMSAFFSPVQHSLGWAYTAALLNGIMDDSRRIANVSYAGKSNEKEEITSSSIDGQIITKSGRSLKAEITDDLFYFTGDMKVFPQNEPPYQEPLVDYEKFKKAMDEERKQYQEKRDSIKK